MGCQSSTVQSGQNNYHNRSVTHNNSVQALMLIGHQNYETYLLTYNFREKKWYPRQRLTNVKNLMNSESTTLNGKLYFTHGMFKRYSFLSFNPANKETKTLHSSSVILNEHAMCSCNSFIYFCGGGSGSNSVLMYDLQKNSFTSLPPMPTRRHAAAAIFHQGFLYVLGGYAGACVLDTVDKYDPATNNWTTLAPMCHERFHHAAAALNGKIYVCGGFGMNSVEFYDPSIDSWHLVDSMNQLRHNLKVFTHEGKLIAVGGDNQATIEVYDPSTNLWQIDNQLSSGVQLDRIYTSFVI